GHGLRLGGLPERVAAGRHGHRAGWARGGRADSGPVRTGTGAWIANSAPPPVFPGPVFVIPRPCLCHSSAPPHSRPLLCHSRPLLCHSRLDRESIAVIHGGWIPACAGMTNRARE